MQTFLISSDFEKTAKCLDYRRLGKQRLEVRQVLDSIHGKIKGWRNHPCSIMWQNHTNALVEYGVTICKEWKARGYKDNLGNQIADYHQKKETTYPWWLGRKEFHDGHKSNLVRKKPEFYQKFWPEIKPDQLYLWPREPEKYIKIVPKN